MTTIPIEKKKFTYEDYLKTPGKTLRSFLLSGLEIELPEVFKF